MVTFVPDIPPGNTWIRMLMNKTAEKSNGELTIKWIGGPEAIPMTDTPAAVQRGVLDICSTVLSFAETMVRAIDAIEQAEYDTAELRANGTFAYIRELFAESGIHFLGLATPSYPQEQLVFGFRKGKEIKSLDDFKGLKIAGAGGGNAEFIQALGATCIPINFPDFFTAIERGAVDGYHLAYPGIPDWGLVPVTGVVVDETFASSGTAFLMNLKKYNSLPPHLKNALDMAAAETEVEGAEIFRNVSMEVKGMLSKEGVKIVKLPHDDSVAFYKIWRKNAAEATEKRNPEMIPKLLKLIRDPDFERLQ
jgi:TRAP-type C4-dicarboxylate transport system substrate-binding protein